MGILSHLDAPEPGSDTLDPKRWWFRLLLLLAVASSYVVAIFAPELGGSGITVCPSRLLTNTRCPSCGFTRSWFAIASGDFSTALHLNVLSFLFFVLGIALIPLLAYEVLSRRDLLERALKRNRWPLYGVIALLIVIRYATLFVLES
jgi:hypothetical protein